MNKLLIFSLFLTLSPFMAKSQTYKAPTSTNKVFLATIKGITYTYQNGVITVKNNGQYNIGVLRISAESAEDKELYGVALFEDGLDKGQTQKTTVYFTRGLDNEKEIPLKEINTDKLVFWIDKATRAQ
ncbi:hypothetical protein HF324_17470 [Chitinophaga oryzae]|uniref:Uncharacterized protein n=1 Tax=Chitinophaga oryzae TaxID=2725414 RepID=A0AAE7D7Q8_9BACT|nr:hypothetical protein [Chitinophaga oryzae]QJB33075.1 hypothetical protein HF329_17835 [Chitinophaga oryzae]QJB39549.1 hypothetical protein HF324_17470 [Chitinophaga oryzae]